MRIWISSFFLMALLASAAVFAADDDEAWIERHMAQPEHSAAPAKIQAGYRIDWSQLRGFTGRSVKVVTERGRAHHGVLDRVEGKRMFLRARSYGGYADLILRADQVVSTELE